ncbi:MAG: hypothetical protein A3C93_01295 [Candidatus Lloydbacteria bacterium RIFCSPHIGHO2_02_FULL_54_17]|uniref:Glycosyltransferase RgtA/B/C/D-like domain-containing protein n=1 Tax=Candidatus Lloydbacteria bacterium RIFCSPHIGHO2_02_FULL_54_17 TaxID=1798664 RepID=A0A1G2DIZ6_9BACT|nr:MAG: hypothetical protein A2762_06190 [Candidatus Lloydbacteria bacterium RIFCSPHIGHO2_01_FULL_54_11]OGZ13635.1 MAG: hypothetical protein A3C93_01295 [Candidatus Lloydbacteria bacterium RIFCSPHIGHO2_02_FULL_54_17]OGZ15446.1 MAG: hypothetical protein A2948_04200 [Candidatus Lloydbacteria bacterium RIFCSPLOWO2_01_FULL_54_18]
MEKIARIRSFFKNVRSRLTSGEWITLGVIMLSLIVGIWHALPDTKVIGDESPYVGGVLRSIASHTLVPHIDYAYTLSFYANYVFMIVVLAVGYIGSGFDLTALTHWLTANQHLLYLVPRGTSALSALAVAVFLLLLGKEEGRELRDRIVVVLLFFSTIVVTMVMHTGKMWTLSLLLVMASVYFFAKTLREKKEYKRVRSSPVFWAIMFAFLAFANFPFNIILLLEIPFLLWFFHDRVLRRTIVMSTLCGLLAFAVLFLVNKSGWVAQNSATAPSGAPGVATNIVYQLWTFAGLLPLLSIALFLRIRRITNKPLFFFLLSVLVLYLTLLVLRAPWAASGFYRYAFYPAFLLSAMLMVTQPNTWKLELVLVPISFVFFIKTLFLLSVPTTYNLARDWAVENLSSKDVYVVSTIQEVSLPKNQRSYALVTPLHCGSRCEAGKKEEFYPEFKYTVLDDETGNLKVETVSGAQDVYVISDTISQSTIPLAVFDNGLAAGYFSVDYRLGIYSPRLFGASRLGERLYVYKKTQ